MSAFDIQSRQVTYPNNADLVNVYDQLAARSLVAYPDEAGNPTTLALGATRDITLTTAGTLQVYGPGGAQAPGTTTHMLSVSNTPEGAVQLATQGKDLVLATDDDAALRYQIGAITVREDGPMQVLETSKDALYLNNNLIIDGTTQFKAPTTFDGSVLCKGNHFSPNINLYKTFDPLVHPTNATMTGYAFTVNENDQLELIRFNNFWGGSNVVQRVAVFGSGRLDRTDLTDYNYVAFDEITGLSLVQGSNTTPLATSSNIEITNADVSSLRNALTDLSQSYTTTNTRFISLSNNYRSLSNVTTAHILPSLANVSAAAASNTSATVASKAAADSNAASILLLMGATVTLQQTTSALAGDVTSLTASNEALITATATQLSGIQAATDSNASGIAGLQYTVSQHTQSIGTFAASVSNMRLEITLAEQRTINEVAGRLVPLDTQIQQTHSEQVITASNLTAFSTTTNAALDSHGTNITTLFGALAASNTALSSATQTLTDQFTLAQTSNQTMFDTLSASNTTLDARVTQIADSSADLNAWITLLTASNAVQDSHIATLFYQSSSNTSNIIDLVMARTATSNAANTSNITALLSATHQTASNITILAASNLQTASNLATLSYDYMTNKLALPQSSSFVNADGSFYTYKSPVILRDAYSPTEGYDALHIQSSYQALYASGRFLTGFVSYAPDGTHVALASGLASYDRHTRFADAYQQFAVPTTQTWGTTGSDHLLAKYSASNTILWYRELTYQPMPDSGYFDVVATTATSDGGVIVVMELAKSANYTEVVMLDNNDLPELTVPVHESMTKQVIVLKLSESNTYLWSVCIDAPISVTAYGVSEGFGGDFALAVALEGQGALGVRDASVAAARTTLASVQSTESGFATALLLFESNGALKAHAHYTSPAGSAAGPAPRGRTAVAGSTNGFLSSFTAPLNGLQQQKVAIHVAGTEVTTAPLLMPENKNITFFVKHNANDLSKAWVALAYEDGHVDIPRNGASVNPHAVMHANGECTLYMALTRAVIFVDGTGIHTPISVPSSESPIAVIVRLAVDGSIMWNTSPGTHLENGGRALAPMHEQGFTVLTLYSSNIALDYYPSGASDVSSTNEVITNLYNSNIPYSLSLSPGPNRVSLCISSENRYTPSDDIAFVANKCELTISKGIHVVSFNVGTLQAPVTTTFQGKVYATEFRGQINGKYIMANSINGTALINSSISYELLGEDVKSILENTVSQQDMTTALASTASQEAVSSLSASNLSTSSNLTTLSNDYTEHKLSMPMLKSFENASGTTYMYQSTQVSRSVHSPNGYNALLVKDSHQAFYAQAEYNNAMITHASDGSHFAVITGATIYGYSSAFTFADSHQYVKLPATTTPAHMVAKYSASNTIVWHRVLEHVAIPDAFTPVATAATSSDGGLLIAFELDRTVTSYTNIVMMATNATTPELTIPVPQATGKHTILVKLSPTNTYEWTACISAASVHGLVEGQGGDLAVAVVFHDTMQLHDASATTTTFPTAPQDGFAAALILFNSTGTFKAHAHYVSANGALAGPAAPGHTALSAHASSASGYIAAFTSPLKGSQQQQVAVHVGGTEVATVPTVPAQTPQNTNITFFVKHQANTLATDWVAMAYDAGYSPSQTSAEIQPQTVLHTSGDCSLLMALNRSIVFVDGTGVHTPIDVYPEESGSRVPVMLRLNPDGSLKWQAAYGAVAKIGAGGRMMSPMGSEGLALLAIRNAELWIEYYTSTQYSYPFSFDVIKSIANSAATVFLSHGNNTVSLCCTSWQNTSEFTLSRNNNPVTPGLYPGIQLTSFQVSPAHAPATTIFNGDLYATSLSGRLDGKHIVNGSVNADALKEKSVTREKLSTSVQDAILTGGSFQDVVAAKHQAFAAAGAGERAPLAWDTIFANQLYYTDGPNIVAQGDGYYLVQPQAWFAAGEGRVTDILWRIQMHDHTGMMLSDTLMNGYESHWAYMSPGQYMRIMYADTRPITLLPSTMIGFTWFPFMRYKSHDRQLHAEILIDSGYASSTQKQGSNTIKRVINLGTAGYKNSLVVTRADGISLGKFRDEPQEAFVFASHPQSIVTPSRVNVNQGGVAIKFAVAYSDPATLVPGAVICSLVDDGIVLVSASHDSSDPTTGRIEVAMSDGSSYIASSPNMFGASRQSSSYASYYIAVIANTLSVYVNNEIAFTGTLPSNALAFASQRNAVVTFAATATSPTFLGDFEVENGAIQSVQQTMQLMQKWRFSSAPA